MKPTGCTHSTLPRSGRCEWQHVTPSHPASSPEATLLDGRQRGTTVSVSHPCCPLAPLLCGLSAASLTHVRRARRSSAAQRAGGIRVAVAGQGEASSLRAPLLAREARAQAGRRAVRPPRRLPGLAASPASSRPGLSGSGRVLLEVSALRAEPLLRSPAWPATWLQHSCGAGGSPGGPWPRLRPLCVGRIPVSRPRSCSKGLLQPGPPQASHFPPPPSLPGRLATPLRAPLVPPCPTSGASRRSPPSLGCCPPDGRAATL